MLGAPDGAVGDVETHVRGEGRRVGAEVELERLETVRAVEADAAEEDERACARR